MIRIHNYKLLIISAVCLAGSILLSQTAQIAEAFRGGEALPSGFHAMLVSEGISAGSQWLSLVLPIFCALPCAAVFVDDLKCGFIKEYLPRTTVRGYISQCVCSNVLCGGAAPVAGIFLAYVVSAALLIPLEEAGKAASGLIELLPSCGLYFLSGALWAVTGLAVSSFTRSRYMAYAAPFIIYYLLIILHERYFTELYVLYPKEWLEPTQAWGGWGAAILVVLLTALGGVVFAAQARRRLEKL